MRALYIAPIEIDSNYYIGVKNKVLSQIKSFERLNCKIDILYIKEGNIYLNKKKYKDREKVDFFENILDYRIEKYDFVYIRYIPCSLGLLKLIKNFNRYCKNIIIEIPTFPYINEFKNDISKIKFIIKDYTVTRRLHKYVKAIATTNDYDKIWGINTIQIRNGIDMDILPLTSRNRNQNEVNLVGLANLNIWHGYDRVIEGLNNYYRMSNNIKVKFYIVGEGKEKNNLINLVDKYQLQDKVIFLGSLRGEELNNIMDHMDIGVSSLALHRAGGGHDPIKTKEFIARGIPVMVGYVDKLVDMSLDFVLKVPANDSAIDIKKLCEKLDCIKQDKYLIRYYAQQNLSWDNQIAKITNLFQ